MPVSAPNEAELQGTPSSGLPLRLRLYISEQGEVLRVRSDDVQDIDQELVERARRMFLATRFLPGRIDTRDVASVLDVQLRPPDTVEPTEAYHR